MAIENAEAELDDLLTSALAMPTAEIWKIGNFGGSPPPPPPRSGPFRIGDELVLYKHTQKLIFRDLGEELCIVRVVPIDHTEPNTPGVKIK